MSDKIIVMQKDGWSYLKSGYNQMTGALIVNGVESAASICPGNRSWMMYEGEVVSLQRRLPDVRTLCGYAIKDEFASVEVFPRKLTPEAFQWDEDATLFPVATNAPYRIEFYNAEYASTPGAIAEVPFIIIDRDCDPIAQPGDVKTDFPHDLREHPETWHKHPCSISAKSMFIRSVAAIKAAMAANPGQYTADDYANIGTFTLKRIMNHAPREHTYSVGKKTKRTTETQSTFDVVKISEPSSNYREGAIIPPSLHGENWADLQPKIDAYLDTIRAFVEPGAVRICDCCNGDGFVITARGAA